MLSLESVQRRCTSQVGCRSKGRNNKDRLGFLGLTTLIERMMRGDLIEVLLIGKNKQS